MEHFHPVKRSFGWWRAAAASALVVPLAACGGGGDDATAAGGEDCAIPEEIRLIVPFSPGGGYDAWGRLMAPVMAEKLGEGVDIVVENISGGGGMRGVNTLYSGPADGSQIAIFSPQDVALAQTLGHAEDDFDLTTMTFLGQFTEDPQVFLASADADFDSIEDLADRGEPVLHAAQELSPIELLTYDAYGVDAEYVLHEGTPEVSLAILRGDADVTVGSLSSILEYLESGDMKPILYVASEEATPETPGYEQIKDAPTARTTGHPELAENLLQNRVVAAAPETPDCVADALSGALAETLEDPEFISQAEEAALVVVPAGPEEAAEAVTRSLDTMTENRDVLEAGMPE